MNILQTLRRLACLLVLPLTLCTAALAEPATKASLLTYFDLMNTQQVAGKAADQVIEGMNAAMQKMPASQQRLLQAELPGMQAEARKHLSWKALQPLAIQSYQQKLQEADIQVLTAYARTPGGQLYHAKLRPALEQNMPAMKVYLRLRFAALSKNRPEPGAVPQPARLPAPGSKAALVYAMMIALPGARDDFANRMASLESVFQPTPGNASRNAELADFVALAPMLRRHISFEELSVHKADLFGDKLSEAELSTLVADLHRPELNAALAMQQAADAGLQLNIANYIGTLGQEPNGKTPNKAGGKKPAAK